MVIAYLVLLGLCLGSFVNAFVWRFHELEGRVAPKRRKELSVTRGRSMCVECGHTLKATDLIPLVSWFGLRGRCRYCKRPISVQYPLVELLTAVLFVASYLFWPYGFDHVGIGLFLLWLGMAAGLIALAVYDIRWMRLPFGISFSLTGFWLLVLAILSAFEGVDRIHIGYAIIGGTLLAGLFWTLLIVSDGRWIGGGDIPLGALLGLLAGSVLNAATLLFFASLLGSTYALPLLAAGRLTPKSRIPFGPFLIAAGIAVFLAGPRLSDAFRILTFGY